MPSLFLSVLRVAGLCRLISGLFCTQRIGHRTDHLCSCLCLRSDWFMQTHYWTVVYTEETSSQDRSSLQLSVFEGWLVYVDSLLDSFVHRGNLLIGQVIFVVVCVLRVAGLCRLTMGQLCTQRKLAHRTGHLCSCLCLRGGWFMQTHYWTVVYCTVGNQPTGQVTCVVVGV